MARATYTPLSGARVAAVTNAIFDAIETVGSATGIDGENFREEGLDVNAFETGVIYRRAFTPISQPLVSLENLPAAFATFVVGAVTFQTGAITLEAGETLELRFSIQFTSDAANFGVPHGDIVELRFGFEVATIPGFITSSVRGLEPGTAGTALGDGVISIAATIDGPLSLDFVEVQAKDILDQDCRIGYGHFYGKIYRRHAQST